MSRLWLASAADRLRGERGELLRYLPDGRESAGGPRAFPAAEGRLAAHFGGTGGAEDPAPAPRAGGVAAAGSLAGAGFLQQRRHLRHPGEAGVLEKGYIPNAGVG